MNRPICRTICHSIVMLAALPLAVVHAQTMKSPDITKTPTLYVVPYAHLDTQWRWEFPQSISEYLLKTMRVNFDYMQKYPHYVFNWTGANRYRLMKEYFPQDYAKMKQYVAEGRWYPAGSSVEEGDVNLPSAEGIFRQILYGNTYFRHEFGKASSEYMLPDCFGFPASLPSILAHSGVKGFSTQKLAANWQPAPKVGGTDSPEQTPEGIPFNVGVWIGPDGERILSALNPGGYPDQGNQDWGHHEFMLGLAGHANDWRQLQTVWQAHRLNNPLTAFVSAKHSGSLGKTFSFLHLNNPNIRVLALKKAEDSDEVVIRLVELAGAAAKDVQVSFAAPVTSAREINAQEQPIGAANVSNGALVTSFTAYQPRTFALHLGSSSAHIAPPHSEPVALQYDLAAATNDDDKTSNGGFDGKGNAIPAEMLPSQIDFDGVHFQLAPAKTGAADAIVAKGQILTLPAGHHNRLYILAASADGDQKAIFHIGKQPVSLNIEAWNGWIGQWDTRLWKNLPEEPNWAISANHAPWPPPNFAQREARPPALRYPEDYVGMESGYVKPAALAWYVSHHHTEDGLNQPYEYSYLFAYYLEIPAGARTLTLPDNDKIRILAVTAAEDYPTLTPAAPLYDTLNRTEPDM